MPALCRPLPLFLFVALLAAPAASKPPVAPPPPPPVVDERLASDEETLRAAGIPTDGEGLLTYFKRFVAKDTDAKRIEALTKVLGDEDFFVREKATEELITIGPATRSTLTPLLKDKDPEVVHRTQRCLEQIDKTASPAFVASALHVLSKRNPAGATETLIALLSVQGAEPQVVDEIGLALSRVGVQQGKADPALAKAIKEGEPLTRAVAAEALYRAGVGEFKDTYAKLLEDKDPQVRLRMGLAFVQKQDKTAMPVLIALLSELPRDNVWKVEDVLYGVAGEKAPEATQGTDDAGRKAYRKAWEEWWAANGKDLDLKKVAAAQEQKGFTLVCQYETGAGKVSGSVYEVDKEGKQRWKIPNLAYPIDAQYVGDDKVLITEYNGRTVSERNSKGEVIWQKAVEGIPQGARRLPNGNTLIITRTNLVEVNAKGENVKTINPPGGGNIYSAGRFLNGDIGIVNQQGQFVRMDAAGKELKRFAVGNVLAMGGQIDVLPNGRVVVPLYSMGKVAEFDTEGKQVWEASVPNPTSVKRLPNGHTLVATRTNQVLELDRNGKQVWNFAADGRLMGASRR